MYAFVSGFFDAGYGIGGIIGLLAGVKLSHDEDAAPPCKKD